MINILKSKFLILTLIVAVILVLAIVILSIGHQKKTLETNVQDNEKIQIAASFYPLYFFTSEIGGDKVNVFNITPAGAEPHEYELTTTDRLEIERSKLLVFNGDVEPWGDKIAETLGDKDVKVVKAAEDLMTMQVNEGGGEESVTDPHVWLDPILAKEQVAKIADGLVEVDPDNSSYFRQRQNALNAKLNDLDNSYRQGLASCRLGDMVTSHSAFGYLAKRYNLNQVAISGLSVDEEPSSQKLAQIADFARKNNIKFIFFESLVSPKLSETIASEVGARTLVLDPLDEGLSDDDIVAGRDYFSVSRENLSNLRLALECQ